MLWNSLVYFVLLWILPQLLVEAACQKTSTQFLPYLLQDLTKLLENKRNHDIIINVDKNDSKKEFYAHSIILETRSAYFENALSNGLIKNENDVFILDFPDISVNVFDILIRYIYGGNIDLDQKEGADVLNLLVACEKLRLKELYDYVQDYLIEYHQAWLLQNVVLVQQVSFKYSEFTKLQNYWTMTICKQPEILFNADDFTSIDKEALLSLYKNEDLWMEENELWDHIIRWGKAQSIELPEEINNWTPNDFNILKKTLDDFISHIRFYEISSKDFCYKIMPYSAILSKELYHDLTQYHLVPNWQPEFNNLTSRKMALNTVIDSRLIDSEQATLISSWIQGNKENKIPDNFKKVYYEFQLLTRGSRDGFTGEVFHRMCDKKGPTITIMKLNNETSILGGYNPLDWDISKSGNFGKTSESFIFSLNKEIILSSVQNYNEAIYHHSGGPNFHDIFFSRIFNVSDGVSFLNFAYDQKIHENGSYIVEEYEVFSVVRKR